MASIEAGELSKNPDFQGIISSGLEFAAAQSNIIKEMSNSQLEAYKNRIQILRDDLKGRSGLKENEIPKELAELSGLPASKLRELVRRLRLHATELNKAFPQMNSLDARTRFDLLLEAVKRDAKAVATMERIATALSATATREESEQTCEAICLALFILFLSAAMVMLALGIAGCVIQIILLPIAILCIVGVIAAFAAFMVVITNIYQSCLAGCQDAPGGN
jgi:hypothetical protein